MIKVCKNNLLSFGSSGLIALLGLISIFNFLSGFVSGIWLAIIGDWAYIIFGIIIGFLMPYAYTLASLLLLPLYVLAVKLTEKKYRTLTLIVSFVTSLLSNTILFLWVIYVYKFISGNATSVNYIPMLIWGYSITLGPLGYMAKNEPDDSTGTALGILFAMLAYIVLVFIALTIGYTLMPLIVLLIIFSLLPVFILQIAFDQDYTEEQKCRQCGLALHNLDKYCKSCGILISQN